MSFHPQYWSTVSDEAKDLIKRLLTLDKVRGRAYADTYSCRRFSFTASMTRTPSELYCCCFGDGSSISFSFSVGLFFLPCFVLSYFFAWFCVLFSVFFFLFPLFFAVFRQFLLFLSFGFWCMNADTMYICCW